VPPPSNTRAAGSSARRPASTTRSGVLRLAARGAGGPAVRRADLQARVVGDHRARTDEDRVDVGAHGVDAVEVLRRGQQQPLRAPVVDAAVERDGDRRGDVHPISACGGGPRPGRPACAGPTAGR
jgi:hypothetical protein